MIELNKYWEQLSSRDRKVGIVGGFVLGMMLIYFMIINPLSNQVEALKSNIIESQQLISWMKVATEQVKQTQTNMGDAASSKLSLLTLIEQSSKTSKLANSVSEIKQLEENDVQLKFKAVVFDQLVEWFKELQNKHGVYVKKITLRRTESAGIVQADTILARP